MINQTNNNLVAIVGFFDGSAGQVETWFEEVTGYKIACFVIDSDSFQDVDVDVENKMRVCKTTDYPQSMHLKGHPLVISSNWIDKIKELGINKVLSLEPSNLLRKKQLELIRESGLELVSAIHPSALILPEAQIAKGVWVNAGVIIGYKVEIGAGTLINTGVQIDHHNILEECCQLDPGVVTAGNVVLRSCCHIHTGVTLINRIEVGENSIVGAGAVVLKNVQKDCTAVGVPAKVIKSN
jgi:sugar O-acyltransferase (sialic acid O-acetyltransferase NeuD family)